MVFNALRTRLSSLWRDETSDGDGEETTGADPVADRGDEMLSYAEQVEYGVDEHDLRDEDKVLRLLVKRGGRVDRETVIAETGWSEERLAAVVKEMEDDNQVSAITVGRKRVICRRGFEPKGYRSHLSE